MTSVPEQLGTTVAGLVPVQLNVPFAAARDPRDLAMLVGIDVVVAHGHELDAAIEQHDLLAARVLARDRCESLQRVIEDVRELAVREHEPDLTVDHAEAVPALLEADAADPVVDAIGDERELTGDVIREVAPRDRFGTTCVVRAWQCPKRARARGRRE